jgi:hypothetical protein|nr:MAG TPA: hypothetical protein [Caudoviricetes sp.]
MEAEKLSFSDIEQKLGSDYADSVYDLFANFSADLYALGFSNVAIDLTIKVNAKVGDSKIGTTKKIKVNI